MMSSAQHHRGDRSAASVGRVAWAQSSVCARLHARARARDDSRLTHDTKEVPVPHCPGLRLKNGLLDLLSRHLSIFVMTLFPRNVFVGVN